MATKTKNLINADELEQALKKEITDFRKSYAHMEKITFDEHSARLLALIESKYLFIKKRGTFPYKEIDMVGGYIFEGGEKCETFTMSAKGFTFSGVSTMNIPLRKVPKKSFSFLLGLCRYMNKINSQ